MSADNLIPQPFRPISVGDWTLYTNHLIPKKRLLLDYSQKLDTLIPDDPIITFTFPTTPQTSLDIHKSRLSLIGGPLAALITPPFRESTQRTIHLPHDDPHTFAAIRSFLYLHPLDLAPHLAHPRLALAAHRWQLRPLCRAWFAARRLRGHATKHALYALWHACVALPMPTTFRAFLALAFARHFGPIMHDLGVLPDRCDGEQHCDPDQVLRTALEQRAVEFASSLAFLLFAELAKNAAAAATPPTPATASGRRATRMLGEDGDGGEHAGKGHRPVNMWLDFANRMANASSRAQVLRVAHEAAAYASRSRTLPQLVRAIENQGFSTTIPTHVRCEQIWALFYDIIAILTPNAKHLRDHPQLCADSAALPSQPDSPHPSAQPKVECEPRPASKRMRSAASDKDHDPLAHASEQYQQPAHTQSDAATRAPTDAVAPSCLKRLRRSHPLNSPAPPPHVSAPTSHVGCTAAVAAAAAAAAAADTHSVVPAACSAPAAEACACSASGATLQGQQQRQPGGTLHVPIPSVDALWDMFYERGLLRHVVYYVSHYCAQNHTSALLRGILQSLESKLTDREAIALLKLLDWEKPDFPVLLSNINRSFSRHALRLLTIAQSEVLARGDSELRFSFNLKNLVNRVRYRNKKFKFETAVHAYRDYRFFARAYCDVVEGNPGPLIVAIHLVQDGMPLPHDVMVHSRVRAIIDGCGCEPEPKDGRNNFFGVEGLPANFDSSHTGVNLMMFMRDGGEKYMLYSQTMFGEWLNSHTERCSLNVFVNLRFGSADAQSSARKDCRTQVRQSRASRVISCQSSGSHPLVVVNAGGNEEREDVDDEESEESEDAFEEENDENEAFNSDLENDLDELLSDDSR